MYFVKGLRSEEAASNGSSVVISTAIPIPTDLSSVPTMQQDVVSVEGLQNFNNTDKNHVTSFYMNESETYNLLLNSQGKNDFVILLNFVNAVFIIWRERNLFQI